MQGEFRQKLEQLLVGKKPIPPWLEDLLVVGPRLEKWIPPEKRANRVLVTEFLARWLKDAGLSQEECLEWLNPYCLEVLAQYSKSGPSAIRHGTKANVRWVYKSDFVFDFEAIAREVADNPLGTVAAYMPILERWNNLQWEAKEHQRRSYVPPVFVPVVPIKQKFREQFLKAMEFAKQKRSEGVKPGKIVAMLNEQGYLTKTGRKWTLGILSQSLRDVTPLRCFQDPPQAP